MAMRLEFIHQIQMWFIILVWILLAMAMLLRPRPATFPFRNRDRLSLLGLLIQGLGYLATWSLMRPRYSALIPSHPVLDGLVALASGILAIASCVLLVIAVRVLGKHFRLTAEILNGHALIMSGPYRFVRHPIYVAMLGLLVATALSLADWRAILPSIFLYLVGSALRIRCEDRLLKAAFGHTFDDYHQRIPALIPGIW